MSMFLVNLAAVQTAVATRLPAKYATDRNFTGCQPPAFTFYGLGSRQKGARYKPLNVQ